MNNLGEELDAASKAWSEAYQAYCARNTAFAVESARYAAWVVHPNPAGYRVPPVFPLELEGAYRALSVAGSAYFEAVRSK